MKIGGPVNRSATVPWCWFWIWVATALAVRSGTAFLLSAKLTAAEQAGFGRDGVLYYEPLVESLLSGRGFAFTPGGPTASHVPGYPLMVAGARMMVGSPRLSILAIQVLAGALAVGLIFLLAQMSLGSRVAHLSAALGLVTPDLMVYSLLNESEMPYLALFLAASVLMLLVMRSWSWRPAILLGLALGLGALTREAGAGLILVWPAALVFSKDRDARRRFQVAGVIVAAAFLTLLPWWVRNWTVFREFIPLTTKGALNLYMGTVVRPYRFTGYHDPETGSEWPSGERETRVAERVRAASSFRERDRIFLEAAIENLLDDPGAQMAHIGRKFLFLWQSNMGPRHAARVGWAPALWAAAAEYYAVLALGLMGCWRLRAAPRIGVVLMLPAAYFGLLHLFVGDAEPRYHLPVVPVLIIAASFLLLSYRGPAARGRVPEMES